MASIEHNFFSRAFSFLKARFAPRGARLSFSASGEDIIMWDTLRKVGVRGEDVLYVDIGAHEPVFGNNTYLFYHKGAHGVLVEPNTSLCAKIKQKRPRDVCVYGGAGKRDGHADFFAFERSTRNTFSKEQADGWERSSGQKPAVEKREIFSLNTLVAKYCGGSTPDIVSIDAEGLDIDILSGYDWLKRPKLFCIENENDRIRPYMEQHGYQLSSQIFQNTIFVDTQI